MNFPIEEEEVGWERGRVREGVERLGKGKGGARKGGQGKGGEEGGSGG